MYHAVSFPPPPGGFRLCYCVDPTKDKGTDSIPFSGSRVARDDLLGRISFLPRTGSIFRFFVTPPIHGPRAPWLPAFRR